MPRERKTKFSKVGEILSSIMREKKVTQKELAKRTKANSQQAIWDKFQEKHSMTIDSVVAMCDCLGVELCIIDGFKKYKISEGEWNPELDLMLNRLNRETDLHSVDKWKEHYEAHKEADRLLKQSYREKDRAGYNAYMNEYRKEQRKKVPLIEDGNLCYRCENYERRIKQNGKGYCPILDKYIAKSADSDCEYFNEREEDTEEA